MSELSKKSEKLASAIYLVTSFFDDNEPLKWRLRTLSTDLVSERIRDKSTITKEVLTLFSIAKTSGLISETNYDILVRELSKFEYDAERSLNLMLSTDTVPIDRTLMEPHKVEYLKDKSIRDKVLEKPILKEFGAVSVKKSSRQSIIVALLKRKKEIMIKDISPLISGCSEKTIQRELSAMVQTGILKKTGEKRWSRYSLA